MAISTLMQFEAVLGDVTKLFDKISHASGVGPKFEEARRSFHEVVRTLKNKEKMTKLQATKFTKACEVFISEYGHAEDLCNKLYDLQDYLEYNPPA
ncbi:MAG: hypothetical protein HY908_04155 [Myxococcales bacterium]|nr:hypothetical protein [Myxococcales bacterium]MCC6523355.1 hypothetical protein [Polyangiaceae bacterium]